MRYKCVRFYFADYTLRPVLQKSRPCKILIILINVTKNCKCDSIWAIIMHFENDILFSFFSLMLQCSYQCFRLTHSVLKILIQSSIMILDVANRNFMSYRIFLSVIYKLEIIFFGKHKPIFYNIL